MVATFVTLSNHEPLPLSFLHFSPVFFAFPVPCRCHTVTLGESAVPYSPFCNTRNQPPSQQVRSASCQPRKPLPLDHSAPLACQPMPLPQSHHPASLAWLSSFFFSPLSCFSGFLLYSPSWLHSPPLPLTVPPPPPHPPIPPPHTYSFPASQLFVTYSGTETQNKRGARSLFPEPLAKVFYLVLCCFLGPILQIALEQFFRSNYCAYCCLSGTSGEMVSVHKMSVI